MTKLTMTLLFAGTARTTIRQTEDVAVKDLTQTSRTEEDCASGSDDTATVQAAIAIGMCLPARHVQCRHGAVRYDRSPPRLDAYRRDVVRQRPGDHGSPAHQT